MTLVDSLDTLAVIGDLEEFRRGVKLVTHNVTFSNNATVRFDEPFF